MSYVSTFVKEFKLFMRYSKNFGFLYSIRYDFYRLLWYKYKKSFAEDKIIETVNDYLEKFLEDQITEYNKSEYINSSPESKNVWVCWWQGYDSMPEWCKLCFDNLKHILPPDYTLTLITKDNCADYVTIPQKIYDRVAEGNMTLTTFSDILREALLYYQGGHWIDSSIWSTPDFTKFVNYNAEFWSIKLKNIDRRWSGQVVSQCMWSGFYLYGKKGNIVTKFAFEGMCSFFEKHDIIIDYFIQNFIIKIGYKRVPQIRKIIDDISYSNSHLYSLFSVIDEPFDSEKWKEFTSDTGAFKVTQRHPFKEEINGEETFFGRIKRTKFIH